MEEVLRVFIAVDLSAEVRRWLWEARALLEGRMPSGSVRWTDPDGIHITLKFLGDTPSRRIEEIRAVMDEAARGCRRFPLVVEGLGCFPNAVRPRVIWAGARHEPVLVDLQKRLEDGLEKFGFPRERRAFSPHLTLGRVRDGVTGRDLAEVGRVATTATLQTTASMEVTGWCLFKSVLRPTGAEYSILHRTAFPSASADRNSDRQSS